MGVCKYMCVNKYICDEYIQGEVCGKQHKRTQLRRMKTMLVERATARGKLF